MCLAMDRHRRQLGMAAAGPVFVAMLRGTGAVFLIASLNAAVDAAGWGMALVAWPALLTVAGLSTVIGVSVVGVYRAIPESAPRPAAGVRRPAPLRRSEPALRPARQQG
jgi:hypothetical protein